MLSIFNGCPSLFTLSVHVGAMYCVDLQCYNLCVHLLFGWSSLQEETVCVVTLLFLISFYVQCLQNDLFELRCREELISYLFWMVLTFCFVSVSCHCAFWCLKKNQSVL